MNDFRNIRHRLGKTQVELGQQLGLSQSTVSKFENGSLAVDERTRLALEALLARANANGESADHEEVLNTADPTPSAGKTNNIIPQEVAAA